MADTPIEFQDPLTGERLSLFFGGLGTSENDIRYPLREGAIRCCPQQNYTDSFGLQWNHFQRTQIDDYCPGGLSSRRLFLETGWTVGGLEGERVLEVGSGAGRFTQVLLHQTQADIYSLDYSEAVSANFRNNGPHPRLSLFQASATEMPFRPGQFDRVICLGVLQHTPDFRASLRALMEMARPGGQVVVDFYPIKGWWTKVNAKYLLRPLTKRLPPKLLLGFIDYGMDLLIAVYRLFSKLGVGKLCNRFVPICDIDATLPKNLSYQQLRELCVLDTFDMFSPAYDNPQRLSAVASWFAEAGFQEIWAGWVDTGSGSAPVVRGNKPE